MKLSRFVACILLPLLSLAQNLNAQNNDAEFTSVSEEFIKGYLAARPLEAVALGFHEFDGKINDYTRLSIDAELSRLKRFDDRLKKFDLSKLNARNSIDLRILQAAISRELFVIQDLAVFERNPMTYANAIDLNIYIARKFAPLEDRVRSIIAIEAQAPNIMIAGKNQSRGEPAETVRRARDPNRARRGTFSPERSGRSHQRFEGREADGRIQQLESQSRCGVE